VLSLRFDPFMNATLLKRFRISGGHLVIAWGVICVVGTSFLWRYESAPGAVGEVPAHWPSQSALSRDANRDTLVLAIHPHCPCSRATIRELSRVMTRCQSGLNTLVLFVKPHEMPDDWAHTDLWSSAQAIPGVSVRQDVDGQEAQRFGAMTSGQCALYSRSGELLFEGGITFSRGHEGDNEGDDAIIDAVTSGHGSGPVAKTDVYGCPLESEKRDMKPVRHERSVQ
jgi:hypothetical protein